MVGKSFTAGEDIFDLKQKREELRIIGKYFKDTCELIITKLEVLLKLLKTLLFGIRNCMYD